MKAFVAVALLSAVSVAYAAVKTEVAGGLGGPGGLSLGVGGLPSGAGALGGAFAGGPLGSPSGVSLSGAGSSVSGGRPGSAGPSAGVRPGVSVVGLPAGGVSGVWFPGGYGVMPLYSRGLWGYGPFGDNYGLGFAGVPLLGGYGYGPYGGVFGNGVWGGLGGYGYGYPVAGATWGPLVGGGFGAAPSAAGSAGFGASSSSAGSASRRGSTGSLRGVVGSSGSVGVRGPSFILHGYG
ncbi:hypothetical protein MTO96_001781 [Rhipicephalus appendiculatus]